MDDGGKNVAIVCGGLTNPGRAISAELLSKGWAVVVQDAGDDVQAQAEALARESGADERLAAFQADLAEEEQRESLVEYALDEFDQVDLLVAPPPFGPALPTGDLLEIAPADVAEALNAALLAPMFVAQRVANEMIRLIEAGQIDGGRIVFLGSFSAYATGFDQACACLAAGGVAMLTRLFADRLGEFGINVYEVRAGLIGAARGERGHERYDELIREGLTPIRRWGQPLDLARAVAAIADDALGFSTGQVLDVDGGFHLRRL